MAKVVQKFGGTSVGSPARIRKIAAHLQQTLKEGHFPIVVVSAMGKTTDDLMALAHQVSAQPPHREMDMLISVGERISMALLSMALADRKVPSLSFTGSQSGIVTTPSHRRARILKVLGDRVRKSIAENKIPIIAGFQGVSEEKEITTLGRGGSDTTAVAMAIALGCKRCEIYTDVDAVYSADPRIVPTARKWPSIPAPVLVEYAVLGADVLHPRCVVLAEKHGIELAILSSGKTEDQPPAKQGTTMTYIETPLSPLEAPLFYGVTLKEDHFLVQFEVPRAAAVASIWSEFRARQLTPFSPQVLGRAGLFYIDSEFQSEWTSALQKLVQEEFISSFQLVADWVPVSIIGQGFSEHPSVVQTAIECLNALNVDWMGLSVSPHALTFCLPKHKAVECIQALHQTFFSG